MKHLSKNFEHSYWELKHYFNTYDLIIIGSGIVGLSTAISFKQKNKLAKIVVLERAISPNGASTKNAGFACFGSSSELLDDLNKMDEKTVWETVSMRWKGLKLLRKRLGDKNINLKLLGGFELFDDKNDYHYCLDKKEELNKKIENVLGLKSCYSKSTKNSKHFKNVNGTILNQYEGQIDTALMMNNLLLMAQQKGISILNNINITNINDLGRIVELQSDFGVFKAKKVVVATNGFATQLLNISDLKPARAQVLITKPISNLKIKGSFHFQQGYYYFRNIDNRILLGGGRNLDFEKETTTKMALNTLIQGHLDRLLKEMILPNTNFEVDHRWSGIMGVGSEKKPIIKSISKNVIASVRMGGMGIAIGSLVGEETAKLLKD